MKKYIEILRQCPLFAQMTGEELLVTLGCLGATVRHYGKKETVLAEGERVNSIGVVLSGSLQIVQNDYFGNRTIVSDVCPSELFAESFACAGVAAIPVDVVAGEDSDVMFIECGRILRPCGQNCGFHKQLVENLVRGIAIKNVRFHQKNEITSKRTTREKLMAYLTLQAKRAGSDRFEIPYTRQELADYLQVDRSGLSAEIGKLQKEGVLKSRRKFFELL